MISVTLRKRFVLFIKIIIFCTMCVYSVNSINYIVKWFGIYNDVQNEYIRLINQQKEIRKNIDILEIKIKGLQPETINLDLLENQAKNILQLRRSNERVILE